MANIRTGITAEIKTRLEGIVAAASNPVGGTYNYTPVNVWIGRRLIDVQLKATTLPAYSVIAQEHGGAEYSGSTRRIARSSLEISIEGRIAISDHDTPYQDAEKAIEDIRAAIEKSDDVSLGDRVAALLWDSESVTTTPENETSFFVINYLAELTLVRGNAATLKPAW